MPYQRTTFVPHPVWGRSADQLRHNIEGSSPVSGNPVMEEIIQGLTRPLNAEEQKSGLVEVSAESSTIGPDSEENLIQYFHDDGMTDYLPIVLPTKERVEAMLKGSSHKRDEIVGKMSPAADAYEPWTFTVEQVAVNAVMAGAKPEYFPVILAIASSGGSPNPS